MPTYRINCYIPVEPEEPLIFTDKQEAEGEVSHLSCLHPENMYEIEEEDDPE
jgi:hypothetical protein